MIAIALPQSTPERLVVSTSTARPVVLNLLLTTRKYTQTSFTPMATLRMRLTSRPSGRCLSMMFPRCGNPTFQPLAQCTLPLLQAPFYQLVPTKTAGLSTFTRSARSRCLKRPSTSTFLTLHTARPKNQDRSKLTSMRTTSACWNTLSNTFFPPSSPSSSPTSTAQSALISSFLPCSPTASIFTAV